MSIYVYVVKNSVGLEKKIKTTKNEVEEEKPKNYLVFPEAFYFLVKFKRNKKNLMIVNNKNNNNNNNSDKLSKTFSIKKIGFIYLSIFSS